MDFINPYNNGFTIYSKSGCNYCLKIKTLLKETNLLFAINILLKIKKLFYFLSIKKLTKK